MEEEVEEGVKMVRELHVLQKNMNDNMQNKEDVELFENFGLDTPLEQQTNEEKNLINFKERKNLMTTLKNKTMSINKVDMDKNYIELNDQLYSDDISQVIYGYIYENYVNFYNFYILRNFDIKKMNSFDCSKFENQNLLDKQHYIDINLKSFFVTGGIIVFL